MNDGENLIAFVDYHSARRNRVDARAAKAALAEWLSDWEGWSAKVDDDGEFAYLTITVE